MTFWNDNVFLTRLWRLLFGRSVVLPQQRRSQRSFMVEPLEDRQLLAVDSGFGSLASPVSEPMPVIFPQQLEYYADTVDVADTTSASLAAALAESDRLPRSPIYDFTPVDWYGNLLSDDVDEFSDEVLSDDVGVSYSLSGVTVTFEEDIPFVDHQVVQSKQVYGPVTYAEYLASLPLISDDDVGIQMMSGCGCPPPPPTSWWIHLGSTSGCAACLPMDSVYKSSNGCNSASDTYITLQSGNTASIGTMGCYSGSPSCNYRVGVEVDDPNKEYFQQTIITVSGSFTWTKPSSISNADARRDFTFTYFAYRDMNNNNVYDAGDIYGCELGSLNAHIGYAEIVIQFAGAGDFKERTTTGGQTANNTVVVGQKVHATIETSDKVSVNTSSIVWAHPSGGNVVRNYVTNNSEGYVVELSDVYYHPGGNGYYINPDLEFYYTSNNINKLGGLNATFNLTDINGKTYNGKTASASYFVDTPTVDCWEATGVSDEYYVYNKVYNMASVQVVGHGSPNSDPGIRWEGKITAENGGGYIASLQLGTESVLAYIDDGDYDNPYVGIIWGYDISDDYGNNLLLDGNFPYHLMGKVNSTTHKASLIDEDSPITPLSGYTSGFKSIERHNYFETYLMYSPDGADSIWVPLSIFSWRLDFKGKIVVNEDETTEWKFEGANGLYDEYPIIYTSSGVPNKLPKWDSRIRDYAENKWASLSNQ